MSEKIDIVLASREQEGLRPGRFEHIWSILSTAEQLRWGISNCPMVVEAEVLAASAPKPWHRVTIMLVSGDVPQVAAWVYPIDNHDYCGERTLAKIGMVVPARRGWNLIAEFDERECHPARVCVRVTRRRAWGIEFRNGAWLQRLDADKSGPASTAMSFRTRADAERILADGSYMFAGPLAKLLP